MPIKRQDGKEVDKVIEVLNELSEGYRKRDLTEVDSFVNKVFADNEDITIHGTCEGEKFHGKEEARKLVGDDWEYWGDFDLNADNAFVLISKDMAFVASKVILRIKYAVDDYPDLMSWLIKRISLEKKTEKEKLLDILLINSRGMYEREKGEMYIIPMKFVGILVKVSGKWVFQHMHFSDYVDKMPQDRIIK